MRTLKDDQFDRRKMEVQQCMESKRTNSPIDFLRSLIRSAPLLTGMREMHLTSYWCLSEHSFVNERLQSVQSPCASYGRRFRQPSWVGVIGAHGARETPVPMPNTEVKPRSGYNTWVIKPWENSTVPNYIKAIRVGWLLSLCAHYDRMQLWES